jgi:FtsP/CotA-like multicopper oxidase with cupredoxin domain
MLFNMRKLLLFTFLFAGLVGLVTCPSPKAYGQLATGDRIPVQDPETLNDEGLPQVPLLQTVPLTHPIKLTNPDPDMEHPTVGAFEGGTTGTYEDAGENNVVQEDQQDNSGSFNIPTGAPRSPTWGIQSFSQMLLRFEEFGLRDMPSPYDEDGTVLDQGAYIPGSPFPMPDVQIHTGTTPSGQNDTPPGHPNGYDISEFLEGPLYPMPSVFSNVIDKNPWQGPIEAFLGRPLTEVYTDGPPAEGRPPGESWSHQRWTDFLPEQYFNTCIAGARTNEGCRNDFQSHGYTYGEFGEGGLYYNIATAGYNDDEDESEIILSGETTGIGIAFHPKMPLQGPDTLWCFDGTLPPKLLRARIGVPILMRNYNFLPIDPSANMGFGLHNITTHEHNGHSPAESDGYTQAFYFPGQFYDYRWPLAVAGHDTINEDASDPRCGYPAGGDTEADAADGLVDGIINIPGDYREIMSTHWFHDHMLDFTAQNVYKGNAVMMNYYSSVDRGNEGLDDGFNLRFPSGTALDWGNRDYDVNLVIADKAWDSEGQLFFNIFNYDGFLGDHMLTNWLYHPYLDVRARKYRFRLLNGGVSRYLKLAIVAQVPEGDILGDDGFNYKRVPFHMIANDGNIMEHAVAFDGTLGTELGVLPTQAIAERYDIIVDFSQFAPGTKLYLVNLLEHKNGKGPNQPIALEDVLTGVYKAIPDGNRWKDGDPCVGKFFEMRVHAMGDVDGIDGIDTDESMDPSLYISGGETMIPLNRPTADELANAKQRTFEFGRSSGTDQAPWTIKTDGGSGFPMDPRRISAQPIVNNGVEIWHLRNGGQGWSHPVHIHFEEGIILNRDGFPPPEWEKWARKDMYRIGTSDDSSREVAVALRFREFAGSYVEHCHNTQHEDHAMLLRYDIDPNGESSGGEFTILPTPMPTWDGVTYVHSAALPTVITGEEPMIQPDTTGHGSEDNFSRFSNVHSSIVPLHLSDDIITGTNYSEKDALVAFMLALTDPRVKYQRAPFDHPQLKIPNGYKDRSPYKEIKKTIPAVGAAGSGTPLNTFLDLDPFTTTQ